MAAKAARLEEDAKAADACAVLGIDTSASVAQIRSAYKRAALDTHPDKRDGEGGFQVVRDAYDMLVNLSTQRARERAEERRIACEQQYALWEEQHAKHKAADAPPTQRSASPGHPGFQAWERPTFRPPSRSSAPDTNRQDTKSGRGKPPSPMIARRSLSPHPTGAPLLALEQSPATLLAMEC